MVYRTFSTHHRIPGISELTILLEHSSMNSIRSFATTKCSNFSLYLSVFRWCSQRWTLHPREELRVSLGLQHFSESRLELRPVPLTVGLSDTLVVIVTATMFVIVTRMSVKTEKLFLFYKTHNFNK
ncbi:uncharacterized protein LOC133178817 [Saccostrea echinata]|uniref:uncharacterized protein LOC133178817 n=1 Tax=Saccostrea echinata TaxID=191078 RepID=UPI002A824790|nr:uncharacterized protein LOC133178817 [Saccostrea echinata]